MIEPIEIAVTVWKSWLNDPNGVDAMGTSTKDRIHWYVPEELIEEVDAIVNTRGGAEKIREMYRKTHWKGMEARLKAMGVLKNKL